MVDGDSVLLQQSSKGPDSLILVRRNWANKQASKAIWSHVRSAEGVVSVTGAYDKINK